jgi:site-specific DNA-methyltransferase (adenine-specific)
MAEINIYNTDCMEFMKSLPDKAFELAIVDPPYGIGVAKTGQIGTGNKFIPKNWDNNTPSEDYFIELKRVSNNQIIWGANYFKNLTGGMIIWNKLGTAIGHRKVCPTFSECEIAYSSIHNNIKMFSYTYIGNVQGNDYKILWSETGRIHPTQKPVALYQWLLKNYAKQGDKILDTHGGSCSIAIACDIMGFDLDVCELDTDYYNAAVERFNRHKQQLKLDFTG